MCIGRILTPQEEAALLADRMRRTVAARERVLAGVSGYDVGTLGPGWGPSWQCRVCDAYVGGRTDGPPPDDDDCGCVWNVRDGRLYDWTGYDHDVRHFAVMPKEP